MCARAHTYAHECAGPMLQCVIQQKSRQDISVTSLTQRPPLQPSLGYSCLRSQCWGYRHMRVCGVLFMGSQALLPPEQSSCGGSLHLETSRLSSLLSRGQGVFIVPSAAPNREPGNSLPTSCTLFTKATPSHSPSIPKITGQCCPVPAHPCCLPRKLPSGVPTVTSVLSREPEPSALDAHTCLLAE